MSTVLSVNDAHKAYGKTMALSGAGLTLLKGEWLALLGPNGAGKTTLIRAIAGRVKLDRGTIQLLGQSLNGDAASNAAARSRLGIVPQDIALYPLLTARENLCAFGKLHGVDGRELNDRVRWALDWTGLADRADALTKTFSGGMKRRLNIACGVLHQPDVVLLDEPTVGVDPQSRQRIWEMLAALRDAGASLLLTTHQLDEAQQICDRVNIIDHGRSIAEGTFDQLVNRTIGRGKRVAITLDQPLPSAELVDGLAQDGSTLWCSIEDVATELPPLLGRIQALDSTILDVNIQGPSLHAVFINLTGRDLRE